MDFESFVSQCKSANSKDELRNVYSNFKKQTKEEVVKKSKSISITMGLVEEVEFVDTKIRPDGTESPPKTIFILVGNKKLYLPGHHTPSHKDLKFKQVFFSTTTSAFGNNNLYHKVEKVLDVKSLLDILSLSHLLRSN